MSARRVLILSVSAGVGHVRAAEALAAYAQQEFPDVETLHLDIMDCASTAFRKLYTDAYINLVNKYPQVWGLMYQVTSEARAEAAMNKLRRAIERLNTRALRQRIAELRQPRSSARISCQQRSSCTRFGAGACKRPCGCR